MLPLVAIVGRPNVGKSTLFNRLVGRRSALVADEPGMTRDRHYGTVTDAPRSFQLVDTGGFEPDVEAGIEALIATQTLLAVEEADLILLVLDAREGLTAADQSVAAVLRRASRPLLYVANKVEGPKQEALLGELYRVGAPAVLPISAAHGLGIDELHEAIAASLPPPAPEESADAEAGIRIALVGRPNAGKSALLNRLVGEQRSIVSELPGTTRDPVNVRIDTGQGPVTIVDTAGIRRKRRSGPALEQLSILWAMRSIEDADVACLVIDAQEGPTVQDAKIASWTLEAGKALVLVMTKSDLLGALAPARRTLAQQFDDRLHFAAFAPMVLLSSVTGRGVQRLMPTVRRVHEQWSRRIATAELNRFLEDTVRAHPPPAHQGRPIRLYFITQPQVQPPTFIISTSRATGLTDAYRRYMARRLRDNFDFSGTPLRIFFRQRGTRGASRSR